MKASIDYINHKYFTQCKSVIYTLKCAPTRLHKPPRMNFWLFNIVYQIVSNWLKFSSKSTRISVTSTVNTNKGKRYLILGTFAKKVHALLWLHGVTTTPEYK